MPDGLQDMTDEEIAQPKSQAKESEAEPDDMADWLQGVGGEDETPEPVTEVGDPETEPADMPDWLQDLAAEEETRDPIAQTEEAQAELTDIPDWLQDVADEDEQSDGNELLVAAVTGSIAAGGLAAITASDEETDLES